jgi:peptide/nickel transport system permease protein
MLLKLKESESFLIFKESKVAIFGLCLFVLIIIFAIGADWISPYDPLEQNLSQQFQNPSMEHFLGTDRYGRDVFSRIIYGARISLEVGIISVGIGSMCGIFLGLVSGYYGGFLDMFIMRIIDMMLCFPSILLALAVVAILGSGIHNVMVAIGISNIPSFARLVRGSVLSIKEEDYVKAARSLGASDTRIIFKHVLPNCISSVIVLATLSLADAIIWEAALSFLGLGVQPPYPSWGNILSDGREYLRCYPWITTSSGFAIFITVLGINLLGDGLRDALDPKLRGL